jgi:hypothetical protein
MERLTHLIEKHEPLLQTSPPAKGLPGEPAEPFHSPQPQGADVSNWIHYCLKKFKMNAS